MAKDLIEGRGGGKKSNVMSPVVSGGGKSRGSKTQQSMAPRRKMRSRRK